MKEYIDVKVFLKSIKKVLREVLSEKKTYFITVDGKVEAILKPSEEDGKEVLVEENAKKSQEIVKKFL